MFNSSLIKKSMIGLAFMALMIGAIPVTAEQTTSGWMEGIPAVVPPFTNGTLLQNDSLRRTNGENVAYDLYYEGATLEQSKKYMEKMKEAGFQITLDTNTREGHLSFFGFLPQGEGRIAINFSFQSNGHIDYTITLIKKYQ